MVSVTWSEPGSSPRVRGTCNDVVGDFIATGIIPACAGNIEV